jgi:hypothetical protein
VFRINISWKLLVMLAASVVCTTPNYTNLNLIFARPDGLQKWVVAMLEFLQHSFP